MSTPSRPGKSKRRLFPDTISFSPKQPSLSSAGDNFTPSVFGLDSGSDQGTPLNQRYSKRDMDGEYSFDSGTPVHAPFPSSTSASAIPIIPAIVLARSPSGSDVGSPPHTPDASPPSRHSICPPTPNAMHKMQARSPFFQRSRFYSSSPVGGNSPASEEIVMSERDDEDEDNDDDGDYGGGKSGDELLMQLTEDGDGAEESEEETTPRELIMQVNSPNRRSSGVSRLGVGVPPPSPFTFGPPATPKRPNATPKRPVHGVSLFGGENPAPNPMVVGAAMPLHYPSDTDTFIKSRRLDIPSFNVTSYSDSGSPPRNRSRLHPGPSIAMGNGTMRPTGVPIPTPHKVLRTNINPYTPDARQHRPTKIQVPDDATMSRFVLDYEVVEVLGGGSFGKVFKVKHRTDGWIYALKKVTYKNTAERERYLNEVYILAAMGSHPNIIRYHSVWEDETNNAIYIQIEFCNGGSLERWMQKRAGNPLREVELCDIIRQVANGLDHLHEKMQAAHLDVKPENILVVEEAGRAPVFKLADLGLIVKRNGGINTPVDFEEGDSRYLPKELLDSECVSSGYITRADIFSLACSAYELALQRPLPKAGESWEAIRKAEIVLPAQYSHDLTGVLKAMLHPDPRCRPTAHQVLEHPVMRSMEERRNYDDNVNLKNALNQAHLKIINLQAKLAQMQQRQKALKRRESFHTIANQASQGQSRDVSPSPMDEDQRDFIGHPNNASQPHPSLRRSATTILGMDVDSLEPMIVSVINSYLNQGRMGAMDGVLQAMTTDIANAIVNARNVSQTLSHRSILTASTPNLERQETFGAVPSPATQRANPLSSSTSQIAAPQQHQQLSAPMQAPSTPPAKIRHIQRAQSVIRISKK